MVFKIKVDKDVCIGCGSCEAVCPENFKMVDGKARVIKASKGSLTCEEEAKNSCPVNAISITKK
jgi:ferredoxin